MVSVAEIKFGEVLGFGKRLKCRADKWQRVTVFNRDVIELIDARSQTTVLLANKKKPSGDR